MAVLIYYIIRRLNFFESTKATQRITLSRIIELDIPSSILKQGLVRILYTVGSGIVLLLVVLLIAAKFKIALIMLPISIYLIGQFFVFNNHVKAIKNQRIYFDSETHEINIEWLDGRLLKFNLLKDVKEIREVRAVQKNNGLFMGYYQIFVGADVVFLPYLLIDNPKTKPFFDKLQLFDRTTENKLFPII